MIVLLGEFNGKSKAMPYLRKHGWGRMWASYGPAWDYDDEPWGFDNGAYEAYSRKIQWNEAKFLRRLERADGKRIPDVAVAVDIVGGGTRSLDLSVEWINDGRGPSHWMWYLAVQDGMSESDVEDVLPMFSGLCLGGTDGFKATAPRWCKMAHRHGKRFHYLRCNREQWIRQAIDIGADSIDTTRFVRALTGGERGRALRFEQLVTGQCPQLSLF